MSEKKTYKSRASVLGVSAIGIFLMIVNSTLCLTNTRSHCILGKYFDIILEPLIFILMSLFLASIFTFFISDKIFKKWLHFTLVWFGITVVLVMLSPTTSHDYLGMSPDKEETSMMMGLLFVIISIVWFILSKIDMKIWVKWVVGIMTSIILVFIVLIMTG